MIIETIIKEDLNEVESLIKEEYELRIKDEFTPEGQEVFETFIRSKEIEKRVIKGNAPAFKASVNNKPVGYIELKDGNRVCLFFVSSEFQKKGVGRKLLTHLESVVSKDIEILEVHSSSVAVKAYEKLGFIQTGDPIVDWGIKYTPMEKRL